MMETNNFNLIVTMGYYYIIDWIDLIYFVYSV